jgi:hypothetical protein
LGKCIWTVKKSPLTPLCQRGEFPSLWQREGRRDYIIYVCILPFKGISGKISGEIRTANQGR